jgi:glycosyltransferase involved in cell wall biosynthesis
VRITFVVPAFNEAESIPALFELLFSLNESANFEVQLLIVENGSQDSTRKVIHEQAFHFPSLSVTALELDINVGYGGALKQGISAADSPVVALLPADGKYDLRDIRRVCECFSAENNQNMMVKGFRNSRNDPLSVQFLSAVLTKISNLLFGTSLKDVNGLPKVFNKTSILEDLSVVPDDACFDAGMIAIWNRDGRITREIPVSFRQRNLLQTSWAGKKFRVSTRMLLRILVFSRQLKKKRG